MTHFKRNIVAQPRQWHQSLAYHESSGFRQFHQAAAIVTEATHIVIIGIGASYNAGLAIAHAFNHQGSFATVADASEFQLLPALPAKAVAIFLSRSGKSIELAGCMAHCKAAGVPTVAITNDMDSPLANSADASIWTCVDFDHAVSVATYSSIILAGVLLALGCGDAACLQTEVANLRHACDEATRRIDGWQQQIRHLDESLAGRFSVFLGRAESLGSCHESKLLWAEALKLPAACYSTGSFRHGPQELLRQPTNVFVWLSNSHAFDNDLKLIDDMLKVGAAVFVITDRASEPLPGVVFVMPAVREEFQGVFNCLPTQLLAEAWSHLQHVDCDAFSYCNYIVLTDSGLS